MVPGYMSALWINFWIGTCIELIHIGYGLEHLLIRLWLFAMFFTPPSYKVYTNKYLGAYIPQLETLE